MISYERISWFGRELRRVKSGLLGFVLLVILIVLSLAFPLLANPEDVENWSGKGEYWEDKMLPKLAPPAWINIFSSVKYPVTTDLNYTVDMLHFINLTSNEGMLEYLRLMDPEVASKIEELPEDVKEMALSKLRESFHFRYIAVYSIRIFYEMSADRPPNDLRVKLNFGPLIVSEYRQGFAMYFKRPDGIVVSLIPGTKYTDNILDVNAYADLSDVELASLLTLPIRSYQVENKTVLAIPENSSWVFSLRDYAGSKLLTYREGLAIGEVMSPIFQVVNETLRPGVFVNPLDVLFAEAKPGISRGEYTLLRGIYELELRFYVRAMSPEELPQFKVVRTKALGIYGLLGTDVRGRDLWPAFIYGLRWALLIGIIVSTVSTLIGVLYGVISGYLGGMVDNVMLRIAQIVYSLPVLPLLIMLAYFFGQNIWNIIWILVIFGWVGRVFVVRSMTLQIKEHLYIEAARAIGASGWRIMLRHVFPQVLPYTFASMALSVPGAILSEAGLSYLGLGDPALVTWGKILHEAQKYGAVINGAWWWVIPPGLGIAMVGLTFVLIGHALDKILNPKLQR